MTSLSVEVFPGALQTEQKIGGWREALENEMNLKDSEAYHKPTGSKYLVGSSSVPYCNSRYPTHMVVMDARTQQVLIDQLFSVPKCVRLARMSERSYDLSREYLLIKPRAQNRYSNYGNYSGTNTGANSSWYRPHADMDKRRSCANCGSMDHHVSAFSASKQNMKAIGHFLDDVDATDEDHE